MFVQTEKTKEIIRNNKGCEICGEEKSWKNKYCSKPCYWKSKVNKSHTHGHKISLAMKGKKKSPEHILKVVLANRGQIRPSITESNHPFWKGDDVGYASLHDWIKKKRGYPPKCEHCTKVGIRSKGRWTIHWANKSKLYKRTVTDWIGLCRRCHYKYDK